MSAAIGLCFPSYTPKLKALRNDGLLEAAQFLNAFLSFIEVVLPLHRGVDPQDLRCFFAGIHPVMEFRGFEVHGVSGFHIIDIRIV